jgi:phosphate:Na+ symporter
MRQVGAHLQQLGGGPLRELIARTLSRRGVPQLAGLISGALTQSTSAVTFIAAGLVSAGAATVFGTLPLLAWANVGTSALVLLAAIDLRTLVFYVFGALGLAFFTGMEQRERYRHVLLALLGLALLLFGLSLLKGSVADLRDDPWIQEFLEFSGSAPAIAFLFGFILATGVQSSSIVTVLTLPLVNEGLLNLDQVTLMIYGASLGSGFAVLLLASGLEGAPRQLALCQAGLRGFASIILLPVYAVEISTGTPLVLAAVRHLSASAATQCGLVYLAFQLTVSGVATASGRWLAAQAVRLSPPPVRDSQFAPKFLFDEGVNDPETALALVRLEQHRLVSHLPEYLEFLRPEEERPPEALPLALRGDINAAVAGEVVSFLSATLRANPDMSGVERLFDARSKALALQSLQDTLLEFATELGTVPEEERPPLAMHMVEGLHMLLGLAADASPNAMGVQDEDAKEMLYRMTAERGGLMDRVRKELLGGAQSFSGREALLSTTLLFERLLWLLRQGALPNSTIVHA